METTKRDELEAFIVATEKKIAYAEKKPGTAIEASIPGLQEQIKTAKELLASMG